MQGARSHMGKRNGEITKVRVVFLSFDVTNRSSIFARPVFRVFLFLPPGERTPSLRAIVFVTESLCYTEIFIPSRDGTAPCGYPVIARII